MDNETLRFDYKHLEEFILLRVEKSDFEAKSILVDFLESNNFEAFSNFLNNSIDQRHLDRSMILLTNYSGRRVREGSIQVLRKDLIIRLQSEGRLIAVEDSLLIAFEIQLKGFTENVFSQSVAESKLVSDFFNSLYFFNLNGTSRIAELPLQTGKQYDINIRNVGQGNWNEINIDNIPRIIFDCGTSYHVKRSELGKYIQNKDSEYQVCKPILVISHWDVDHYHLLKAMDDATIKSFPFVLCRDYTPSLTSRVVFSKLTRLTKVIAIESHRVRKKIRGVPLYELLNISNKIVFFNSGPGRSKNMDALSILVKTQSNSALLTGDQHYEQFDKYVLNRYLPYRHVHNLVVPHHGGHAGKIKYDLPTSVKPGKAIISVGKNTYGHPFPKTVDTLRLKKFKVIETRKSGTDILISL